jgi:NodT family efflux transporter outer membrane factor (OMF) lipoprotein
MRQAGAACLLASGLVVASACAPKTPYVAPEAPAPPAFKENANWKTGEPADAALRGTWWDIFNDDTLNALQARIDVSNQTLKQAEARFAEARAAVGGARAALYPQAAAAPAIARAEQSGNRAVPSVHQSYADFLLPGSVAYEPDVWGRIRGSITASRTLAQATAADLETINLSVHAELALDYFSLRGLDRDRELLDSAVEAYQRALELTQNRFTGGLASQADVALAETQLETTRAQAADLGVARAAFEHAIAVLVGDPAGAFALAPAPQTDAPPSIPVGLPSELLERRPDVAAAERRLASANAEVGVARAAFYPIFSLTGAGGFESTSLSSWITGLSSFWSVGPAALVTVLVAFREVEDQLAALRVLSEEAAIQQRAVEAAERSLQQATLRYRGGLASYLEVTFAQSVALQNERTAVGLLTRRMTASVLLIKGLGGGWNVSSLPRAVDPQ